MEKLNMKTPDLTEKNIQQLGTIFPDVITELRDDQGNLTKGVDFDLLRQKLSSVLAEGSDERYRLDWPGKKASLVKANTPINKTLRPVIEESVDFDNTQNLYIEGDNFKVLKILQESYLSKVNMIYIDPPYNTGKDFIYKDNFNTSGYEYEVEIGVYNDDGGKLFKNNDSNGRYHSDWLSMMYERLLVAKDLLSSSGVIFISIDDNEVHNLRKICDEIFGEEHFISDISIVNNLKGRNDKKYIAKANERLLMYVKSEDFDQHGLDLSEENLKTYDMEDEKGKYRLIELRKRGGADTRVERPNMYFPLYVNNNGAVSIDKSDEYWIEALPKKSDGTDGRWRWGKDKVKLNINYLIGKSVQGLDKYNIYEKDYLEQEGELRRVNPKSVMFGADYSTDVATKKYRSLMGSIDFTNPKSVDLISDLIQYATPPSSSCLILDFFSGSATTAHSVLKLNASDNGNRRFLLTQLQEKTPENSDAFKAGFKTIADIGKERIRRAGKKIKEESLADLNKQLAELDKKTQQGSLLEDEDSGQKKAEIEQKIKHIEALDIGFRVYKVDSSNMKDVYYHPSVVTQEQLSSFTSNIKEDRTAEDILTQVILDLGLELSLKIEKKKIRANDVFFVQENSLVACFDETIDFSIIDTIAQVKPLKVVFRDSGFKEDKDRINLAERFKRLSPETSIRVI